MGKVAFIKNGNFSNSVDPILKEIKQNFREYEIVVIDIWEDIILKYDLINMIYALLSYNVRLLSHNKTLLGAIVRNYYFYTIVRKRLLKILSGENYSFTIQLQSIFDAHIPGIPHFIYTDHSHLAARLYPDFRKTELYSKRWIKLEQQIYKNATTVYVQGNHVKSSLVDFYGIDEDKVVVAGAGSNSKPKEELSFISALDRYSNKTILFVGNEWERKGGPQLYTAFLEVLKRIPDAQLIIIGCTPNLKHAQCKELGYLSMEELEYYYNTSSVFCTPSKKEPFGYVFLEAYKYKLPIVARRIGAMPDIIVDNETGFIVDSQKELVDRLILLLSNPIMTQAFGQRGYEKITNYFTWELTINRISKDIKRKLKYKPKL